MPSSRYTLDHSRDPNPRVLRYNDGRMTWRNQQAHLFGAQLVMNWMASWADDQYVNEDCPDECSTPHEMHRDQGGEVLRCPESGSWWEWCDGCEEWLQRTRLHHQVENNRPPYPRHSLVDGEWYCDPQAHGHYWCDPCQRYVGEDQYAGDDLCTDCHEERYDEDDYGYGRGSSGEQVITCDLCHTQTLHVHALTEDYLCDCRAMTAHSRGETVLFHGDGAQFKFLSVFGIRPLEVAA